jgi:hypothetical protein
VFAHFSLPNVPDVARRTVTGALIVGVAALVAAVSLGYAFVGLGAAIGLALGTLNFRLVGNSVSRAAARGDGRTRGPLAVNTLGRMGIVTVITLGLLLVSAQLGFGVLGGLAIFQVLLLVNVARSMIKAGALTSMDDVIDAPASEPVVDARPSPEHPALDEGPEGV